MYFETLQISTTLNDDERESIFIDFNENVYPFDLVQDDFDHLTKEHGDDRERVHEEWTQHYGFPIEGFEKNTGDNCGSDSDMKQNGLFQKYESFYEQVHSYIFH